MISRYFQKFLVAYNAGCFKGGDFSYLENFAPGFKATDDPDAILAKKECATEKFKLAIKIKPKIEKIIRFFEIVEDIEQKVGVNFSPQLVRNVNRFFYELDDTIESFGNKDTVVFVYSSKLASYSSIFGPFIQDFNNLYLGSLKKLYNQILDELSNFIAMKQHELVAIQVPKAQFQEIQNKISQGGLSIQKLKMTFDQMSLCYESSSLNLRFSQNSHNPRFTQNGGPFTRNKLVADVAAELANNVISPDMLPLSIYPSEDPGDCYVRNNRTFTAFSRAQRPPRSMSLVLPTTEEALRPKDLLTHGEYIIEEGVKDLSGVITQRIRF